MVTVSFIHCRTLTIANSSICLLRTSPYCQRSWNLRLVKACLYSTVIPDKSQAVLLEQMKQYIDYKNYKTLFGDMMPLTMSNALNINRIVISKRSTGCDVMTLNTGDKPGSEMILPTLYWWNVMNIMILVCSVLRLIWITKRIFVNPEYCLPIPWKPPRQPCFFSGGKVMYYQQQLSVRLCEYSGGEWEYNVV